LIAAFNHIGVAPRPAQVSPSADGTALALTDELTRAADYARDAKSESTRRAYRSDWQDFEQWCAPRRLATMPAEVGTVAAYLAHLADTGLKASTISRRCAAITYAHRLSSAAPPTSAEPVKAVLKGIRRRIGVAVKRKAPATARAIAAMSRLLMEATPVSSALPTHSPTQRSARP
jgi:hypothetical protein